MVKVSYYDTPYSVPSWGMKYQIYDNVRSPYNTFYDDEVVFTGWDQILSHSWGQHTPPAPLSSNRYLIRWYGYFYAKHTGTYKFFGSADDGVKIYLADDSNRLSYSPEDLPSELSLRPTKSTDTFDNWSSRSSIATFSGWRSLTEGNFYPIRIEYLNIGSSDVNDYGDICVRFEEPYGAVNSDGEYSVSGRIVLSAGSVNYPAQPYDWEDADSATFVGPGTGWHYLDLPDIISIDGDRAEGKVGEYKIRLPLAPDKYRVLDADNQIYTYGDSNVYIRPGRLLDINIGFQTQCRFYNNGYGYCNLGLKHITSGGYFLDSLCSTTNQKCPFQQPMPGDYVKRLRGRIIGFETVRERDASFIEVTCQDNLYYPTNSINENYPNAVSYAHFDYEGEEWGVDSPDGVGKPIAYDNFKLKEAIIDLAIKSGIDPTYLYGKEKMISTISTYNVVGDLVQGDNITLSRNFRYGNPFFAGTSDDKEADDKYIWSQGFGDKLIDLMGSLAENYGFLFTVDPNGYIVFKSRENPTYYAAGDSRWSTSANWHRIPNKNALGGSYLIGSGTMTTAYNAHITVSGSRFDLYMALNPPVPFTLSVWNLMYNEGFAASGWQHGVYSTEDVQNWNAVNSNPILVGSRTMWPCRITGIDANISTDGEADAAFPVGATSFVMVRPKYSKEFDTINIRGKSAYAWPANGIGDWSWKVTVSIGQFSIVGADPSNAKLFANGVTMSSETTLVTDYDITSQLHWGAYADTSLRIPVTAYTLASGTSYALKFTTKLYQNGTEVTQAYFLNQFRNDISWFNAFKNPNTVRVAGEFIPNGIVIHSQASPSPIEWRYLATQYATTPQFPSNGGAGFTWNESTQALSISHYTQWQYGMREFIDLTLEDVVSTSQQVFGVRVLDDVGTEVYNKTYSQVFEHTNEVRFSNEGVDPTLGYNPNIIKLYGFGESNLIEGTHIRSQNRQYTIAISGYFARIEGVASYPVDVNSPIFNFNTVDHITRATQSSTTEDIRNDIVVVGNLRGPIQDPNTGNVVNPNNPELDYLYARAVDVGSSNQIESLNSLGRSVPFIIYEPNLNTQEHCDWLALAVLDRYKKVVSAVDAQGIAVPFLDIDDPVTFYDFRLDSLPKNGIFWVNGYSENVSNGKYEMTISTTPLQPWPSFTPKPGADLNDYLDDNGLPNAIVNIKLSDETGAVRNSDAGGTNYDCYESEGGSANNPGEVRKLRLTYTQLVDGFLAIRVVTRGDGGGIPGDTVAFLVGREDEDRNFIQEKRYAGEYSVAWDGIDILGRSRIPGSDSNIVSVDIENIYSADGKYYVEFVFDSTNPNDHEVLGAPKNYQSSSLPDNLNPDNATHGETINSTRSAQFWNLEIGEVTEVDIGMNPETGANSPHKWSLGGNQIKTGIYNELLAFSSKDNDNRGVKVWLKEGATAYHKNRGVKYKVEIGIGQVYILPFNEFFITGSASETYVKPIPWGYKYFYPNNDEPQWLRVGDFNTETPAGESPSKDYDGWTSDPGGPIGTPSYAGTDDEFNPYLMSILPNLARDSAVLIERDYQDKYVKINPQDSAVFFNPSDASVGLRYDTVPRYLWDEVMLPYILESPSHDQQTPSDDFAKFQQYQILFASKWFNIWFEVHDRSGRRVDCATKWRPYTGIGQIDREEYFTAFPSATDDRFPSVDKDWKIAVRAHWVPSDSYESVGRLSGGPTSGWLREPNHAVGGVGVWFHRRMNIPEYVSKGHEDVCTDSTVVSHALPCVFRSEYPYPNSFTYLRLDESISTATGAQPYLGYNNIQTYFGRYVFFAWPIHTFWEVNNGAHNYSDRVPNPFDNPTNDFRGGPSLTRNEGE